MGGRSMENSYRETLKKYVGQKCHLGEAYDAFFCIHLLSSRKKNDIIKHVGDDYVIIDQHKTGEVIIPLASTIIRRD